MSGFQNCVIYGNVGQAPDIQFTPNGTKVAKFSLAVNRVWRDKHGDKQEDTTWFRCEVWGEKQADVIEQYVGKGDPLLVQGEIRTYEFEGKDGKTIYGWNLNVVRFQLMGGRKNRDDDRDNRRPYREERGEEPRQQQARKQEEPFEDDIPF